jgi:hypothetical protein
MREAEMAEKTSAEIIRENLDDHSDILFGETVRVYTYAILAETLPEDDHNALASLIWRNGTGSLDPFDPGEIERPERLESLIRRGWLESGLERRVHFRVPAGVIAPDDPGWIS